MRVTSDAIESAEAAAWSEQVRAHGSVERERFVLAHAALVRHVAQRILTRLPASVELADLVNDGLVGLIEAIDRFDPARGVRFSAYAEARVKGAILDALRARDVASRSLRRKLRELDSATARMEQRLGRPPSEEDLAKELGIGVPDLGKIRRDRELARVGPAPSRASELDVALEIPSLAPDPYEQVAEGELIELLTGHLAELPERDRLILSLYYEQGLTLREIGAVLCVTESRVCQIHTRSLRILGERLKTRAGAPAAAGRRD